MKKRYMEPQMIVEDFRVSEMIAKNCAVIHNDLKIVQQIALTTDCESGGEEHWSEHAEGYGRYVTKGTLYHWLNDMYGGVNPSGGYFDLDKDGRTDNMFNAVSRDVAKGVCLVDPTDYGLTFQESTGIYVCSEDSSVLMNS